MNTITDIAINECRVVLRDGREIECFPDERAAGAYIQHVYGVTPWEAREIGIEIRPLRHREPRPGDAFVARDHKYCVKENGVRRPAYGVLCQQAGKLAACFDASAFRHADHVSVSGGPIPFVEPERLTLVGLHRQRFWQWGDGDARAHNDGNYYVTVPLWSLEA